MDTPQNLSHSEINDFLTRRLGEKEANEMMNYIDGEVNKEVKEKVDSSKREIISWREQMKTEFATKEDARDLQQKLIKRVRKAEGTLILWNFVFWVTALLVILCFIKFFK